MKTKIETNKKLYFQKMKTAIAILLACLLVTGTVPAWGDDGVLETIKNQLFPDGLPGDYADFDELDIEEARLSHEQYGSAYTDLTQQQIDQYNAGRSSEMEEGISNVNRALEEADNPQVSLGELRRMDDAIDDLQAMQNRMESKAKIIGNEVIYLANREDPPPDPKELEKLNKWRIKLDKFSYEIYEALKEAEKHRGKIYGYPPLPPPDLDDFIESEGPVGSISEDSVLLEGDDLNLVDPAMDPDVGRTIGMIGAELGGMEAAGSAMPIEPQTQAPMNDPVSMQEMQPEPEMVESSSGGYKGGPITLSIPSN